ncbi:P-loop NTPase fold protein [Mesorhizobium sp. ES1-3]|uniref:KAP family P-loop NTPase fold protein n=1 Tax=Mesorhizobium sp. ES1-3 TaxID=2876628 RepID=UPI001CCDFA89|nr:P-loop NTPase fold protein [Mesorhizobium sp. ES1-3]MBZ9671639.1 KAP family NTPase [Mesorhizobium sp. ES1-3]
MKQSTQPDSDRPLDSEEADLFGFVGIARRLAPAVLKALEGDGMVIGLEGPWGSGKTTLLNFLRTELKRTKPENVHVISIAPWLSGDMSNLVGSLIEPMADILDNAELGQVVGWKRQVAKIRKKSTGLGDQLRGYGAKTGRTLAPAARFAEYFAPGAKVAADALELGSQYLEQSQRHPTTAETKAAISSKLSSLDVGFVVILDDLDRLEPPQALEVVRLIRSVADFPKIAYLMCYDREVLSQAIKIGLKIEDGDLFLQKIVQLTFSIPLPEPFDLRTNFLTKALEIFKEVTGAAPSGELLDDLKRAIDREGSALSTPREVKLALNGVRFVYPTVAADVYFPDMCRLHLIKTTNPPLYRWLEEYLSVRSVLATGDASIGKDERKRLGEKLAALLPSDESDSLRSIWSFRRFVPGVIKSDQPDQRVFSTTSLREMEEIVAFRRLGSPIHYRYYFALTPPKTVMPDKRFEELLELARTNPDALAEILAALSEEKRTSGKSWFEHVLNRLDTAKINSLDGKTLSGLILSICESMDTVLRTDNRPRPFSISVESLAKGVVEDCLRRLRRLDADIFQSISHRLASECTSMNWLVGTFFRGEIWHHGIVGDQKKNPETWVFNEKELGGLLDVLRKRASARAQKDKIPDMPDVASYLFGWRDLSGLPQVQAWITAYSKPDEGFLFLLDKLRSWAVSDKVYYPLQKSSVAVFLNWEATLKRLDDLKQTAQAEMATELLKAIEQGKH